MGEQRPYSRPITAARSRACVLCNRVYAFRCSTVVFRYRSGYWHISSTIFGCKLHFNRWTNRFEDTGIPSTNPDETASAAVQTGVREGGYSVPLEGLRFFKERFCPADGGAGRPGRGHPTPIDTFSSIYVLSTDDHEIRHRNGQAYPETIGTRGSPHGIQVVL